MKKNSVWIIDDDMIFKIIAQKIIQKSENLETLSTFSNGQEALAALESAVTNNEKLPDIILLDIEMPLMDGWEFICQIKPFASILKEKKIRIYILSSSIAIEDKLKAQSNSNISGYLTKPITLEDLVKIIS
ncbi:response regulator [Flavobacterium ponti]|uniref:Response regulator n=1 Tax=Flavobacterium ponti TaxID=665133 RepID=A0ABV9P3L7_9FLAO